MLGLTNFKTSAQSGDTVVVCAKNQEAANAIKAQLSLRNEPVFAVSHQALADLEKPPLLLILDVRELAAALADCPWIHKVPTLVLAERFDEEQFLSARDLGVLDYLLHPVSPAYLLAKVIDALKQIQEKHQSESYRKLLGQLGAIRERSGVFSTAQTLNRLDQAIADYCADPESPYSLLLLSWRNMPSPCPKPMETVIYQTIARKIRSVARANDWVGEYMEEKFLIVLPNTTVEGANAFGARLLQKLKAPIHVLTHGDVLLTFSIQVAEYQQGQHYEAWLKRALVETL
ncbi:MAG: diguanylate cyclase [Vampirovibrionales bacterium]|nr:diguanylate cyclase [Vampirovibrionales bacterium]